MDTFNVYNSGGANTDLSNLTPLGKQNIVNIANAGGLGTVKSVNSNLPDVNGNIDLTADDIPAGVINKYANDASLGDLTDVTMNNPIFSDVLFYDSFAYNPPKWINRALTTNFVPEPNVANPNNKYYLDSRVSDYIKTILANNYDLLTVSGGNLTRISLGNANQVLSVNNNGNQIIWVDSNQVGIQTLSQLTDVAINTPAHQQALIYNIFTAKWDNTNLTTDLVPEGIDVNRRYYTDTRVSSYLLNILNNGQLLFNNNGNIEGLLVGANGRYIRSNGTTIAFAQINSDELTEGTTNLFYLDSRVQNYLKTILTTSQDLLTRNSTNQLVRLAKGANNTILSTNNIGALEWVTNSPNVALTDLTDVTITTPTTGQVLYKSAGDWVNQILGISDITNLQTTLDAKVPKATLTTNGDLLFNDGTIVTRLPRGTNGQYLQSTATSIQWATIPAGKQNLSELDDVTIINVANNQFLRYDTGNNKWNNRTITTDDIPGTLTNPYCTPTSIQTRLTEILTGNEDILIRRAGVITRLPFTLNDNTLYLGSDGNQMVWKTVPAGAQNLFQLQDVLVDQPPIGKAVYLKYDAGFQAWINAQPVLNDIDTMNILNPINKDVMIYDTTPNQWINRGLEISDINALQTDLNTLQTNIDNLKLIDLADTNVTDLNLAGWLYWNSTTNKWEKYTISIGNVVNLQQELDSKINASVMTTNGDLITRSGGVPSRIGIGADTTFLRSDGANPSWQNIAISDVTNLQTNLNGKLNTNVMTTDGDLISRTGGNPIRIGIGTNGQFLKSNGAIGSWQSLAISDTTNLQTTLDGKVAKADYTTKGRIIAATGAGTYQEQAQPTALYQILTSDITNALNNTGLLWAQLALNNNYFSNINITTPTNKQLLTYDTASTKWINSTFDGSFALPLIAPNTAAYWGAANIPFRVTAAQQTGLGLRAGGSTLVLFHNGLECFSCDGTYFGSQNGFQNALRTDSSLASPIFVVGTSNACVYASANAQGTLHMRWNWGQKATANWGWIDSTSLSTSSRLDIKSTKVEDYRLSINNLFNSYSFQNSNNTSEYLKIDTSTNDRLTIPRNAWGMIYYQDGNIVNNLTLNNTLIKANLGNTGTGVLAINAPNATTLTYNDGTGRIDFQRAGTYKINVNMQMLQQDPINAMEILCFNATGGGAVYPGGYKRASVNGNNYTEITMDFIATNITLPSAIDFYFRIPGGATKTFSITSYSITATNLFTS